MADDKREHDIGQADGDDDQQSRYQIFFQEIFQRVLAKPWTGGTPLPEFTGNRTQFSPRENFCQNQRAAGRKTAAGDLET